VLVTGRQITAARALIGISKVPKMKTPIIALASILAVSPAIAQYYELPTTTYLPPVTVYASHVYYPPPNPIAAIITFSQSF
jgi:hypothetical protein